MFAWKDLKNNEISFIQKFIKYMIEQGMSPKDMSNLLKNIK